MEKTDKIFVAGHKGLVGSSLHRCLTSQGFENIITRSRQDLDLTDEKAVDSFFSSERPSFVFLAAAKVGGILANSNFPADFIHTNLSIQNNVISCASRHGIRKLLFLGSSCIYPKLAKQPISEEALLTGELEPTNLPYAVAKIAGKILCDSYRSQYGLNAFTVMPSNVYGPGDNFHPEESHVVAGLMRRIHQAKLNRSPSVTVWGSGTPLRELIYVDDLAAACIHLMESYQEGGMINVGSNQEYTIKQIAKIICDVVGYEGKLKFDLSKPDGTPRKIMDNAKIMTTGWRPNTNLITGLTSMYQYFLSENQ